MTARASAKRNEAAATERRVDFIFMGLKLWAKLTPEDILSREIILSGPKSAPVLRSAARRKAMSRTGYSGQLTHFQRHAMDLLTRPID
jgi:hypothetical protein